MFDSLLKATVGIIKTPVDVVADIATLGGVITDKDEPYTVSNLKNIMKNLDDATK